MLVRWCLYVYVESMAYLMRCPVVRSHKISNRRDEVLLKCSYHFEDKQVPPQQLMASAKFQSDWKTNNWSNAFKTSGDLFIGCLVQCRNGHQISLSICYNMLEWFSWEDFIVSKRCFTGYWPKPSVLLGTVHTSELNVSCEAVGSRLMWWWPRLAQYQSFLVQSVSGDKLDDNLSLWS